MALQTLTIVYTHYHRQTTTGSAGFLHELQRAATSTYPHQAGVLHATKARLQAPILHDMGYLCK